MENQDSQQVCFNGHQITTCYHSIPGRRKEYCSDCGEKTIYQCPTCSAEINGRTYYEPEEPSEASVPVPDYCEKCGAAYPWSGRQDRDAKVDGDLAALDPTTTLTTICKRFSQIVMPLLNRRKDHQSYEIRDEYDVQDLLHALLKIFFDDIRPDDFSPSYAGKNAIIDFLLLNEQIAIEVKMAGETENRAEKRIGEELTLDIAKYMKHPHCKFLFCFVYDPWHRISNPVGLQNDLEKSGGELPVKVVVAPV